MTDTPYADAARDYLDAGWWPIPVWGGGGKTGIPKGYTGFRGKPVTKAEVYEWSRRHPDANLAIRLPRDVVAIDVDDYDGKAGASTIELIADAVECELPGTVASTARALPSGKLLYRVPVGARLKSAPGPGVEVCQFHHRYVVAAPSTHHTGNAVRWIDTASGEVWDRVPEVDDLPDLPWEWLAYLSTSGSADVAAEADDATVRDWITRTKDHRLRTGWLGSVLTRVTEQIATGKSRHDTTLTALCQIARETEAGAYSASDALTKLRRLWNDATKGEGREGEFPDMVAWAVGQLGTDDGKAKVAEKRAALHNDVEDYQPPPEPTPEPEPATDTTTDEPRTVADAVDEATTFNPLTKFILNWDEFWATDHSATDWIIEPLFAAGRAHALYAGAKTGKSYLVLAAVAALACGRPFLDKPAGAPQDVLYVDYEMTPDDLHDRLVEFGYGPSDDLSRLHYALLPSLPPLDTDAGGLALTMAASAVGARFVVIDTTGRATEGDENEASTFQAFYRHTGMRLKQAGIGWVRLDHAGKDAEKGQRGSSAKNDDVDVVIKLTRNDTGVTVAATHRRMGWYPEQTVIDIVESHVGVMEFNATRGVDHKPYAVGTVELALKLDALDVPLEMSRRAVRTILNAQGISARNAVLSDALRFRRNAAGHTVDHLDPVDNVWISPVDNSGTTPGTTHLGNGSGTTSEETPKTPRYQAGTTVGTTGDHGDRVCGDQWSPLRGTTVPTPAPTEVDLDDDPFADLDI